jgi:hypothetical protein
VTPNIAPFTCQNADEFLSDGIHPTRRVTRSWLTTVKTLQ